MNIAMRQRPGMFDESDRKQGVAVLSEKAARILWPEEANPVGRRFMGEDDKVKTLVGMSRDVRAVLQQRSATDSILPLLAARTRRCCPGGADNRRPSHCRGRPSRRASRRGCTTADSGHSHHGRSIDDSVAQRKFQADADRGISPASALLVASLGIYGVVAYSVARRRNEIGIRMALGAQRSQLLGLVIRQGMTPVVAWHGSRSRRALFLGRAIRGLLFEVQPTDPLTIAGVILVLLAIGVLACLVPARRAAETDVMAALRFE